MARRTGAGLRVREIACLAGFLMAMAGTASPAAAFVDPLDAPARTVSLPSSRPILAVVRAGDALVGVGSRGLIVRSVDDGATWTQAPVPVQSDLTAVAFPTPRHGWAVGHEGVILHSADGGLTWEKQFDGRIAADRLTSYYRKRIDSGDTALERSLEDVVQNTRSGAVLPFLGVWFADDRRGYAVGSFGLAVETADGGKTWLPFNDRIDNPDGLNLNQIAGSGAAVAMAGERGTVFLQNLENGRFERVETGYRGSFFGLAARSDVLLAFGLGGNLYRSEDRGKTWTRIQSGTSVTLTGAALLDDGRIVLSSVAGQLLVSSDDGRSFTLRPERGFQPAGVAVSKGATIVLFGMQGVSVMSLDDYSAAGLVK